MTGLRGAFGGRNRPQEAAEADTDTNPPGQTGAAEIDHPDAAEKQEGNCAEATGGTPNTPLRHQTTNSAEPPEPLPVEYEVALVKHPTLPSFGAQITVTNDDEVRIASLESRGFGMIERWNEFAPPKNRIANWDQIVSVNAATDPMEIIQNISNHMKLRMQMKRFQPDSVDPIWPYVQQFNHDQLRLFIAIMRDDLTASMLFQLTATSLEKFSKLKMNPHTLPKEPPALAKAIQLDVVTKNWAVVTGNAVMAIGGYVRGLAQEHPKLLDGRPWKVANTISDRIAEQLTDPCFQCSLIWREDPIAVLIQNGRLAYQRGEITEDQFTRMIESLVEEEVRGVPSRNQRMGLDSHFANVREGIGQLHEVVCSTVNGENRQTCSHCGDTVRLNHKIRNTQTIAAKKRPREP